MMAVAKLQRNVNERGRLEQLIIVAYLRPPVAINRRGMMLGRSEEVAPSGGIAWYRQR